MISAMCSTRCTAAICSGAMLKFDGPLLVPTTGMLRGALAAVLVLLTGCSSTSTFLPGTGPSRSEIVNEGVRGSVLLVDVTDAAARQVLAGQRKLLFSEALAVEGPLSYAVGKGDVLEISVWEAPPALLFRAQ
jgi:polysaccharide biosynthesis/export protein